MSMTCPHCGYEGEMHADYYEAVWQTIDGEIDSYDYTGCTGSYDDGSTQDECIRCPSCYSEVEIFGRFRFVPSEVLQEVDDVLNREAARVALAEEDSRISENQEGAAS